MTAVRRSHKNIGSALISDNPDAAENKCGFSDKNAQQHDSRFLFLSYFHFECEKQGANITSLFVHCSVYLTFFDTLTDIDIDRNSLNLSSSLYHSFQWNRFSAPQRNETELSQRRQAQKGPQQDVRKLKMLKQKRLKQKRLKQKRLKKRVEQKDLQKRLAQALQTQENLNKQTQHKQKHEKWKQERMIKKRHRQEVQDQGRQKQEQAIQNFEWIKKHHTQFDMKSVTSSRDKCC